MVSANQASSNRPQVVTSNLLHKYFDIINMHYIVHWCIDTPRKRANKFHIPYTLLQNGRHLDILLFLLNLDLDASFKAKYSFEFAAQERGIKG